MEKTEFPKRDWETQEDKNSWRQASGWLTAENARQNLEVLSKNLVVHRHVKPHPKFCL